MVDIAAIGQRLRGRGSYPEHSIAAYLMLVAKLQGVTVNGSGSLDKHFWHSLAEELKLRDIKMESDTLPANWEEFERLSKDRCDDILALLKRSFPKK